MKVSEVKVNRKINLGNYESLEVGVTINPNSQQSCTCDELKDALLKLDMEILNVIEEKTKK